MVYISGGNELLDPAEILGRLGIRTGHKVANLGSGRSGHFTIPAARLVGSQTYVYAVDVLQSVLRSLLTKARIEGVSNIKTVWSNLEVAGATKIPAKSLDFALVINILFQSKERQNIIGEAVRLLKDGGKLLVIDWNQIPAAFGPPSDDRVKTAEVKKIAKELNLKLIDDFDAGNYHYGLIFEK